MKKLNTYSVFVDGCVVGLVYADKEENAALDFVQHEYPTQLGYFYTIREDSSVRVESVDKDYAKNTDADPYFGRLYVVHAEGRNNDS